MIDENCFHLGQLDGEAAQLNLGVAFDAAILVHRAVLSQVPAVSGAVKPTILLALDVNLSAIWCFFVISSNPRQPRVTPEPPTTISPGTPMGTGERSLSTK